MSESKHWKGLHDKRFNEILERALTQALCEFENAPVVAALCDAGVPMWFMMSLTRAMQLDRTIRFYLSSRDRLVVATRVSGHGPSAARDILSSIGFVSLFDAGLSNDRMREILSHTRGVALVVPDWVTPGSPTTDGPFDAMRARENSLARHLPTTDSQPERQP